jgi:hypothetical protein
MAPEEHVVASLGGSSDDAKLLPLSPWSGGVIAPAGDVSSTAADMLKFGAAVLDAQSPLKAVFA